MIIQKIPCPRFEFRWEPKEIECYNWICRYSLVIPLGEYDCRRGDDVAKTSLGTPDITRACVDATMAALRRGFI